MICQEAGEKAMLLLQSCLQRRQNNTDYSSDNMLGVFAFAES